MELKVTLCPHPSDVTILAREGLHGLTNQQNNKNLAQCGGLSDNSPHRFIYLNTSSPVGGIIWKY